MGTTFFVNGEGRTLYNLPGSSYDQGELGVIIGGMSSEYLQESPNVSNIIFMELFLNPRKFAAKCGASRKTGIITGVPIFSKVVCLICLFFVTHPAPHSLRMPLLERATLKE